ncbi:MAG TPA: transglutaminase family protein [Burkholderiales bacterium]|nr:transglutaminase family protein [Burkholderiales bacterium]
MTIRVALTHETTYRFDHPVKLSPHEIRLRPAPHCRTPIIGYSLKVSPAKHFINWQQDPFGNWLARVVFPQKSAELKIVVDLVADMTVINPFDFFVESYAGTYPFVYAGPLGIELRPFLETEPLGPLLSRWLAEFRQETLRQPLAIVDLLVAANARLQRDIAYIVRLEQGVQSCEETLRLRRGSCRDSAWLLVQIFRHLGLAARFASGYLIQLSADVKALDGPSGPEKDFTDLHAWTEVYIPGAGWVGMDPTSGLFAGEGHVPLACTASPSSAAPVTGFTDVADVQFGFRMDVVRIHEDPRVTRPYAAQQWGEIETLARKVDGQLLAWDVRLTMGGEPTFVSIDDMDGVEWNVAALGEKKRKLAGELLTRLRDKFSSGGLLHYGQGKWYPGEALPRWALSCFWRADGKPLWKDAALLAEDGQDGGFGAKEAGLFAVALAGKLGLHADYVVPAYEDVWQTVQQEQRLPTNVDPLDLNLVDSLDRKRLARLLDRELGKEAGYVLPLRPAARPRAREAAAWLSSPWPLRREHLYLLAGDSPIGLRLPLDSLPWIAPADIDPRHVLDPFEAREALHDSAGDVAVKARKPKPVNLEIGKSAIEIIHTALCVQAREGRLHIFFPPLSAVEDWVDLVAAVETTALDLNLPVVLEGYAPPFDPRIRRFAVTPDPGVIEVNIHPAATWDELSANTRVLYEQARLARLGTEKFMLDGRHTGTGGGNHVTIGGLTPADSPLLRRPDLLRSLITYWQNHPALSYLFSGMFIGPTSQAPRVDEARDDNLYELDIAFQQMERKAKSGEEVPQPWLVDRLLRNLLVDVTGNTHRAEFSIDKLYSPDGPAGRLGLLEFRAFEMPPHWQMSLTQMLLLRALIARFWKTPHAVKLVAWGTSLHDRFMLPHFVAEDMKDVVADLHDAGYAFQLEWFAPFFEFRFPRYGTLDCEGMQLELRQALEPWHVLGEEAATGGTSRYVDSSVERMQVKVSNLVAERYVVTCNKRIVPLTPTGTRGEYIGGVRYKAWEPPSALHPTIGVNAPLVFDLIDKWGGRAIGGCTYHVSHPGGRTYEKLPVNANSAEARRVARFMPQGHTPGPATIRPEAPSVDFPLTLDLRRQPDYAVAFDAAPQQAQQQQ